MEDVSEVVGAKQLVDELGIGDRTGDERRPGRNVLLVAAAEVVENDDVVACFEKV
jgi:hypothetical protein